MSTYIHQRRAWPNFYWEVSQIADLLAAVRNKQGRLLGRMESLGFELKSVAVLESLALEIIKSNEIEGEQLNADEVRSSLARRLGMDIPGLVPSDRHVDGVVNMMLDATQKFAEPLNKDRLFGWHACMFPSGRSGMFKIDVGNWRKGPIFVVSGPSHREQIHFEAPPADTVEGEMQHFLDWFNTTTTTDPVIKAAIAHLWFVTIHPFDDGNGRMTRAITEMQLARADGNAQRFYSMSAQILKERKTYYSILQSTQKGNLDITEWLLWFLAQLEQSLLATDVVLSAVLQKARFWKQHNQQALNSRQQYMLNKALDGFDGKITAAKWAKINKCSHDTALRDIQELIAKNILDKDEAGGRSTAYLLKWEE